MDRPEPDIDTMVYVSMPAMLDSRFHPTGVIPSVGVLAEVEESRLRDPSTHFVRSGRQSVLGNSRLLD